jgi:hypothetical protein
MRALLAVIAVVLSFPALADSKAGEKKAQLCLLCDKPRPGYSALLEVQPVKYLVAQVVTMADALTEPLP